MYVCICAFYNFQLMHNDINFGFIFLKINWKNLVNGFFLKGFNNIFVFDDDQDFWWYVKVKKLCLVILGLWGFAFCKRFF